MIGIYEIRNIKDNKIYVGSSVHILRRFSEHRRLLRSNKHHSIKLQRAWNKYGENCFVFSILHEIDKSNLKIEEQKLLDNILKKRHLCYNISIDATAPTRGRKASKKTIAKRIEISATKEWKERQSNALKKYFSSSEARKKSSDTAKLLMSNPIHKSKVMEASILARKKPEIRKKMSDCHKGIRQSEESKKKKSSALLKLYQNEEYKRKFTGIISSEIVRKNMSEGAKKRWSSQENKAAQSERTKSHFSNPENVIKNSEKTKAFFANPENRKAAALRQPTKLSKEDIEFIREKGKEYGMQIKLVNKFNISPAHISNIVNNKSLIHTASL